MAVKVGTKMICKECLSEFIVTKSGESTMKCCGKPLEPK